MVNAQQYLDENYPKEQRSQITELDISNKELEGKLTVGPTVGFDNVRRFNASFNKLTSVSWQKFNVEEIDLSHNQFSGEWRFSGGKIRKINFSFNDIKAFFYDNGPALTHLGISNNNLTQLDLRTNKNLVELNCSNNPLLNKLFLPTSFDPISLDSFDCRGTNLNQVNTSSSMFDCQNGIVYPKFASPTTLTASPTEIYNLPSSSFKLDSVDVSITTTAGVVLLGGATYYIINRNRKKKERYLKQLIRELEKENRDLLQLSSLIGRVLDEKEIKKISFFNNTSSKNTWLNKNCALFISKKNKKYRMWLAIYEPSFEKIETNVRLVKVAKNITQIPDEWEKEIKNFKSELEESEYPGAKVNNNIYTTELPSLAQSYPNITKRKIKISAQFKPDGYIKPYDIVKRKIDYFGFTHHYAIYLGDWDGKKKQVVHISKEEGRDSLQDFRVCIDNWENFLKDAKEVEIYHPFIPFKRPELIRKHIDIAVRSKYGWGKYHLLKENCEHFATMCVYGLGMSQQSRMINEATKDSGYLLQAIQESNEFFQNLEKGYMNNVSNQSIETDNQTENTFENGSNSLLLNSKAEEIELDDLSIQQSQIQIPPK